MFLLALWYSNFMMNVHIRKKHISNSFSRSFQWCNQRLAMMLRSRDIQVSFGAFQKKHTVDIFDDFFSDSATMALKF